MDQAMPIFQAKDLAIERGDRLLFSKLNLSLHAGQMLQIKGKNGSGKSTLLNILCDLLPSLKGKTFWQGLPLADCRDEFYQDLFYSGHLTGIKPLLTVAENLRYLLLLADNAKQEQQSVLKSLHLSAHLNDLAESLSAGQKRRILLAALALSTARIWILDEPFASLDQQMQQWLADLFCQHSQKGGVILFTSHQSIANLPADMQTIELSHGH